MKHWFALFRLQLCSRGGSRCCCSSSSSAVQSGRFYGTLKLLSKSLPTSFCHRHEDDHQHQLHYRIAPPTSTTTNNFKNHTHYSYATRTCKGQILPVLNTRLSLYMIILFLVVLTNNDDGKRCSYCYYTLPLS